MNRISSYKRVQFGFHVVLCLCLAIATVATKDLAAQNPSTKVTISGISITKPNPRSEFGMSLVPGRMSGVEIHIRVESSDLHIISIASGEDQSIVISVPGGKSLEAGDRFSDLNFMSQIDDNGRGVTIPINATELPPSGTTKLLVKGEITLTTGSDLGLAENIFELDPGTEGKLGEIDVEIEEVEEDPFGDDGMIINFKSNKSLASLQEIKFYDAQGAEIKSSSAGQSSYGFNQQMTYNSNFRLVGKHDNVTAKVKYFKSTKDVVVPIEREVTLGLGD